MEPMWVFSGLAHAQQPIVSPYTHVSAHTGPMYSPSFQYMGKPMFNPLEIPPGTHFQPRSSPQGNAAHDPLSALVGPIMLCL